MARLADAADFQWIARTVTCEPAPPPPAARAADEGRDGVRVPAGRMPVDVEPTELRVGDQVLAGGRLVAIQVCARASGTVCGIAQPCVLGEHAEAEVLRAQVLQRAGPQLDGGDDCHRGHEYSWQHQLIFVHQYPLEGDGGR
ncbi:hypothetical protein [Streptomyces vinaceus]|uniref:hypothetical protein n=1 Tax=Streptomyces vinaceus TaxID=1960 RepID=UPI003676CD70